MGNGDWEVYDEATGLLGATDGTLMRVRMLAVRLRDGDLMVVSPGALTADDCFAALAKRGAADISAGAQSFPSSRAAAVARALPGCAQAAA